MDFLIALTTGNHHGKTGLGGHRDGIPGRVMSLREIASHHGISEGAIRKRAKRDDWSRDLNARIQQKADDLVRKQEVRKTVRTKTELTERVLIEATAEVIASVRMEHRGDIRRPGNSQIYFLMNLVRSVLMWGRWSSWVTSCSLLTIKAVTGSMKLIKKSSVCLPV